MKAIILALLAPLVSGLAFTQPKATQAWDDSDLAVHGYSPKPTEAPLIEKRQAISQLTLAPDNVCGYYSVNYTGSAAGVSSTTLFSTGSYFCRSTTDRCGFAGTDLFCGSGTSFSAYRTQILGQYTGCYNSASTGLCNGGCLTNTQILKCSSSTAPFCNLYSLIGGGLKFYDCDPTYLIYPTIFITSTAADHPGRAYSTLAAAAVITTTSTPTTTSPISTTSSTTTISSAAATSTAAESSGVPLGAAIGGGVGGGVALIIIAVVAFLCIRRNKKRKAAAAVAPVGAGGAPPNDPHMSYASYNTQQQGHMSTQPEKFVAAPSTTAYAPSQTQYSPQSPHATQAQYPQQGQYSPPPAHLSPQHAQYPQQGQQYQAYEPTSPAGASELHSGFSSPHSPGPGAAQLDGGGPPPHHVAPQQQQFPRSELA